MFFFLFLFSFLFVCVCVCVFSSRCSSLGFSFSLFPSSKPFPSFPLLFIHYALLLFFSSSFRRLKHCFSLLPKSHTWKPFVRAWLYAFVCVCVCVTNLHRHIHTHRHTTHTHWRVKSVVHDMANVEQRDSHPTKRQPWALLLLFSFSSLALPFFTSSFAFFVCVLYLRFLFSFRSCWSSTTKRKTKWKH